VAEVAPEDTFEVAALALPLPAPELDAFAAPM